MQCPICDKERDEIKYPEFDLTTGFIYCEEHIKEVIDVAEKSNKEDNFVTWLQAIAEVRKQYLKKNKNISKKEVRKMESLIERKKAICKALPITTPDDVYFAIWNVIDEKRVKEYEQELGLNLNDKDED